MSDAQPTGERLHAFTGFRGLVDGLANSGWAAILAGMLDYFAYGSNMNGQRMRQRLGWLPVGFAACLRGYRLRFNKQARTAPGEGYANIEPMAEAVVYGVLYDLQECDLEVLDDYEGVAMNQYRRLEVEVQTAEGPKRAVTYIALAEATGDGLRPRRTYLDHLLAGEAYLPGAYLGELRATATLD